MWRETATATMAMAPGTPTARQGEVPSHYSFRVNNSMLACLLGLNKFLAATDIPAHNMPIRIHCKTGSLSARLVFETRAKCQDFVVRFKDDGLPYASDSPFCSTSATILFRQSKSPEDREIGRRVAPLGEVLVPKLRNDAQGNFVVPALDVRAQVLGVGKPVFRLAPCGHEQKFNVIAPNGCKPYI